MNESDRNSGAENPYASADIPVAIHRPRTDPPRSTLQALLEGAKAGLKWAAYICGAMFALSMLMMIGALIAIIVVQQDARVLTQGKALQGLLKMLGSCLMGFLFTSALGAVLGAVIGLLVHGARRALAALQRAKKPR